MSTDDHHIAPFPLEGGRAGDGGGSPSAPSPRPRIAPGGIQRARRLRREQSIAEKMLWDALRPLKMNFRRQAPIGHYVADFAHFASSLIIEVDGPHHDRPDRQLRDAERTAWFEANGFRLIRFPEKVVRDDLYSVVDQIVAATAPPPSPALPPSRGKGVLRYDIR
ncbi:endonuclease domain-containing protein [Brevundimonas sp.]|uniref:endonuclease domain-containing protein n=1 Tax=Brevundimonas sp. TaxID=1871086 RepID=UPI0035AD9AF2